MSMTHVGWTLGSVVLAQTGPSSSASPPPGPALSSESPGAPGAAPPAGTQAPGGAPPPGRSPGPFGSEFIWILVLMFVVMILISSMGGRKEKRRRAEMLAGIARNDKVHTVGGIIGTITDIHDQEVVLRTDEASNTRVRVSRSAISQVIRPGGARPSSPELEVKPAAPVRT